MGDFRGFFFFFFLGGGGGGLGGFRDFRDFCGGRFGGFRDFRDLLGGVLGDLGFRDLKILRIFVCVCVEDF